jgi:hypothetical protein
MRPLRPLAFSVLLSFPALRAADGLDVVLYLVGDAGRTLPAISQTLRPLAAAAAGDGARCTVALLGDNLYPAGLPPPGAKDRAEMETRLLAQIDVARGAGRGLVIPGNHDWAKWGEDGWNAVLRQEAFVREHGGPTVSFVPSGGCPGPVAIDVGTTVRLIVLDTHWWLHKHDRPAGPASPCSQKGEGDIVAALREALRSAGGRRPVVLAHHPLESGGRSGSHFTWQDHLFPLTTLKSWLWLPLPLVGSLGVAGRIVFASPQQMCSPEYRHLKETLARAFEPVPPFLWASGHDHNLQVIRGTATQGPRWNVVSGAGGGPGRVTPVREIDGTRFCRSAPGYIRIAFDRSGRVRLTVVAVPEVGRTETAFAADLD